MQNSQMDPAKKKLSAKRNNKTETVLVRFIVLYLSSFVDFNESNSVKIIVCRSIGML